LRPELDKLMSVIEAIEIKVGRRSHRSVIGPVLVFENGAVPVRASINGVPLLMDAFGAAALGRVLHDRRNRTGEFESYRTRFKRRARKRPRRKRST
jgi:hypothetical protein